MPAEDVRDFFTRHHDAYRTSQSHGQGPDLEVLIDHLALAVPSHILDVATGTGHTALRLAALGHTVIGLDLTEAMLHDARELAVERGLTGQVSFTIGDAANLPFEDASFDAVTCRRAAHHFADVTAFLLETRRTLRPGGRLGIADLTADPAAIGDLNDLERIRDASHQTALSPEGWQVAIAEAGLELLSVHRLDEDLPAEAWLHPVGPDTPEGHRALERITSGRLPPSIVTAKAPATFHKHRVILVARRP